MNRSGDNGVTIRVKQFLALTGLAATELFRQPACFLLIVCNVALTILLPLSVAHQLGQTTHLAVDSSLAFELVFGVLLAGYAACATLYNEGRSGTILIIFSKPVSRLLFFLAKFAAVTLVLAFFVYCSGMAALLAERLAPRNFEFDSLGMKLLLATPLVAFLPAAILNFLTRRPFIPWALGLLSLTLTVWVLALGAYDSEGHRVAFGTTIAWTVLPAAALEGLALLVMATLALSLAGRLAAPATVSILTVMLFAGLIADHLVEQTASVPLISAALRLILPDIQAFWPADRLAAGGSITLPVLGHAAVYSLAYGSGLLSLGYAAFRNRQF